MFHLELSQPEAELLLDFLTTDLNAIKNELRRNDRGEYRSILQSQRNYLDDICQKIKMVLSAPEPT